MKRKTVHLRGQLETKLGVRGRSFEHALRRTGRRLPRGLRKKGQFLVKAEAAAGHPKSARTLDVHQINAAYDAISDHLAGLNASDIRRGRILSLLGSVVFNLLVVSIALITFLWWRGFV